MKRRSFLGALSALIIVPKLPALPAPPASMPVVTSGYLQVMEPASPVMTMTTTADVEHWLAVAYPRDAFFAPFNRNVEILSEIER